MKCKCFMMKRKTLGKSFADPVLMSLIFTGCMTAAMTSDPEVRHVSDKASLTYTPIVYTHTPPC